MLKLFRQRKTAVRVMLGGIVGVIGLTMVITLVPFGGTDVPLSDPSGSLAQVGSHTISRADADRLFRRYTQGQEQQSDFLKQLIMERVVDDLVTQGIVEYEAERLGLQVTPAELSARLREINIFFPDGNFVGPERYRLIVQQEFQMTVPQFEEMLRRQALASKLFYWVTTGVTVAPEEIDRAFRERAQQAGIEFALLRPADVAARVALTEAEIRAAYDAQRDRYQVAERRAVRYASIDFDSLKLRLPISPGEIESYYQTQRDTYALPERARIRHILSLRARPGANPPPSPEQVRAQAEDLLAQLRRGADFAKLAREHSDHADSREKGGEVGWVRRGQAPPELEKVIFSAPPGAPPVLVETSVGFHIVQVEEHQLEQVRPLAEVRGEIDAILREQKSRTAALEEARKLAEAVRAGKTLEAAARAANWPVRTQALFTRAEPLPAVGAGPNDDFQDAAFRLPAASAGQPNAPASDPVVVPSGYALLQLQQVQPSHTAAFEEVRGKVEQSLRQERAQALVREAAKKLAADAAKDSNLARAAKAAGVAVRKGGPFARFGNIPEIGPARDVAPLAFSLAIGAVSPPVKVGENWIVFRVLARHDPSLSEMNLEQRKALRDAVFDQKRGMTWGLYQADLRKRLEQDGKLKLNQAAINRLTGKKS